jgi:hypothetical protein
VAIYFGDREPNHSGHMCKFEGPMELLFTVLLPVAELQAVCFEYLYIVDLRPPFVRRTNPDLILLYLNAY